MIIITDCIQTAYTLFQAGRLAINPVSASRLHSSEAREITAIYAESVFLMYGSYHLASIVGRYFRLLSGPVAGSCLLVGSFYLLAVLSVKCLNRLTVSREVQKRENLTTRFYRPQSEVWKQRFFFSRLIVNATLAALRVSPLFSVINSASLLFCLFKTTGLKWLSETQTIPPTNGYPERLISSTYLVTGGKTHVMCKHSTR